MADGRGIHIMWVEEVGQLDQRGQSPQNRKLPGNGNDKSWFTRLTTDFTPGIFNVWLAGDVDSGPRHGLL